MRPSGLVYLTEDLEPSAGFYRFVPKVPGRLAEGGALFMLRVPGRPDLRRGVPLGERFAVEWVPIEHPDRGHDPATGRISGVHDQGIAAGGSRFTRLEGCFAADDAIYFTATNGGSHAAGQVFCYRPQEDSLEMVFQSVPESMLHYPDNVCLSPRGGLLICQDSPDGRQHLWGLTPDGGLFPFARNEVVLDGHAGFKGDFRRAEWAGACYSPDGRWLFANVYAPGISFAITGPWREGWV
ncbi:MAG: hypothetical protein KatS3mg126_1459 [Lysobacteraceae bacterium]|nr:MAG: hypothetical protein KatS3mg126_1459 [Xanthomonadaceae bacterium]